MPYKRIPLCFVLLLAPSTLGESLIANYSVWRYLEGIKEASDPPDAWRMLNFDDSSWKQGRSGFSIGFGNYDAPTRLWGMPRVYPSLFLRKIFTLEETEWIKSLVIRADYDDGFVAYLNGTEVARRGLNGEPNQPVPFNAPAVVHSRGNPELIDLEPYRVLLEPGENILTIQAHNSSVASSWFAIHIELLANVVRGPLISATTSTSTKIAWRTLHPTTSVIEYGHTAALGQRLTNETLTTDHVLQLTDLKPGTEYHYKVGGEANGIPRYSQRAMFQTLKPNGPVKLMVLGDTGRGNLIQHKIASLLRKQQPDAVLHAGDVVYPDFTTKYEEFRHFSVYKEHMKSTPYFTTIGNHDLYQGDTAYIKAFHLPTNNLPIIGLKDPPENYRFSGTEHFYSFDVGDAHVSVLYNPWFAHHDITKDTNQLHWLTNDLSNTTKPWKLLLMHFPVASSSGHGWSSYNGNNLPDSVDFGNVIHPIAAKYNVDLMLAGHSHAFEKFNPVAGCISVVSGAGGASTYSMYRYYPGSSQFWSRNNTARILIDGEQLILEAFDPDGKVFDWLVVNRAMPEKELWQAAWHSPIIESQPANDSLGNLLDQTFDLIGEPIPAINGSSANLSQVRVNNDHTHLYIGFEQAMIRANQNIFLFIDSPRQNGVANLDGLGNGQVERTDSSEGVDGLDFLQNLSFTNFKPSLAAILGDELADSQSRHFTRPDLTIKIKEGVEPNEIVQLIPFPLGQGLFHLDQGFSNVDGARFQQFNRSPQQFSQPEETDAGFIEIAIPYTSLGGVQPGDEITIGAVVGTGGINTQYQYRQLDSTYLGKNLTLDQNVFYRLEGLKVRLSIDPDPDNDGLTTERERQIGTNPAKHDTDGDWLPDGWEIARGLNPVKHGGTAALALDPDEDGMSSADELVVGTNPNDNQSVFTLKVKTSEDGIHLRWPAIPKAVYQIVTADSVFGPYQSVGKTQRLDGALASEMEWNIPKSQLNQSTSYFRVQVTPGE